MKTVQGLDVLDLMDAFRIIECEPQRKDVVPPERKAYDVRARELGF
jgi:hypothetical protein